jgi:hypothetical protein
VVVAALLGGEAVGAAELPFLEHEDLAGVARGSPDALAVGGEVVHDHRRLHVRELERRGGG